MLKRILSVLVSFTLVAAFALPVPALAAQPQVEVDNHSASDQMVVSGISIDGVEAPAAGTQLDDSAAVTTAEGEQWDIPVLWIDDSLQLATQADEGRSYLPALAFFVPNEYSVEGDTYTVQLSESLAKLFGTEEIVSVYAPSTGITYILPASLRDYFNASAEHEAQDESAAADNEIKPATKEMSLVDIFCAQTARDNFTDEDLSWFIDLVINKLQPQAVNLLIEKFPAFADAAQTGSIGKRIGLYIYFKNGDMDGLDEHESASSALAYVGGDAVKCEGEYMFSYMIGIDLDDLTKTTKDGQYYRDPKTGKYVILRDGESMRAFENTIVHELFHALMDDYNRTGMAGGTNINDVVTKPDGTWKSTDQANLFKVTHYPMWFIEGSASTVENVYTFRKTAFELIYPTMTADATISERISALLEGYLDNRRVSSDGKYCAVDIGYSDVDETTTSIDPGISRYVSGYLATLYLSELAARSNSLIGSSMGGTADSIVFSSDKLRLGLNCILERMHNGETLNDVVKSVSVDIDAAGNKVTLYNDVADFEEKFIKGKGVGEGKDARYYGDETSSLFVVLLLDYFRSFETKDGGFVVNGSILEDFGKKYESPLDPNRESDSDYYEIAEINRYVQSTVPDSEALKGGGRTRSGTQNPSGAGYEIVYPQDGPGFDWVDAMKSLRASLEAAKAAAQQASAAGNLANSTNDSPNLMAARAKSDAYIPTNAGTAESTAAASAPATIANASESASEPTGAASEPAPAAEPATATEPKPANEPAAEPTIATEPASEPASAPKPASEPASAPASEPEPAPTPEPVPASEPASEPAAAKDAA